MPGRIYYGWWVVAAVFLVLTVSSGFGFYNLSVYINVLAGERGFSVSDVSVAVSLFFVVGGVTGMTVARLIDRYDVRWVMIGGALLGGVALGTVGFATSLTAALPVCSCSSASATARFPSLRQLLWSPAGFQGRIGQWLFPSPPPACLQAESCSHRCRRAGSISGA
jgi:MFS family permease